MDDPDEFNHRDQDPRTNSSTDSQNRHGNFSGEFSPHGGMSDIPLVETMNSSKNRKTNVHVPVINTETLNCLNIDHEITFRDSMREDKKTSSPMNNQRKTLVD